MKQPFSPWIRLLTLIVFLLTPSGALRAGGEGPASVPEADGKPVTLNAVDRPLAEVLTTLSGQIGQPIVAPAGLDLKLHLTGQGIPFTAVMRNLVRGYRLVGAWHENTLYVALPPVDLERLRQTPTAEVVTAFGAVYGPLLRAGAGPYLPEAERQRLVTSLGETLAAMVEAPADSTLPARLLEMIATTGEARLTQSVARPVIEERLQRSDWPGAAAAWRRAYPGAAPAEAAGQGWRIAAGLALAGERAAAADFLREASLSGSDWVTPLRQQLTPKPRVEEAEAVAGAYRAFLQGRPAAGVEAELGRDLVAALARLGKADTAEQLWRATLLKSEVTPATLDAALQLFQGLLVAGGPKRAAPAWRDWYQWERLRPAFENDGQPATDNARFALLRRMFRVATALGPAPPELNAFQRKVRFARPRTLRIVAVLDRRIQTDSAWKEKTINRIDFASQQFEKAYGLKFEVVDFQFWVPRDETGPNGAVEQLRARKAKAKADFIIGFILHVYPASAEKEAMSRAAQIVGYASPEFGGTMMLRDMAFLSGRSVSFFSPDIVNETSVHELGHAFGALHTDDTQSVMRQGFGAAPAFTFDRFNSRICLLYKEFDFDKGFECFDEGELRELAAAYRELAPKCKRGNGSLEREAKLRFLLGRRLRAQGRRGEAITQFAQVIKIGEPKLLVKQARLELTRLQASAR